METVKIEKLDSAHCGYCQEKNEVAAIHLFDPHENRHCLLAVLCKDCRIAMRKAFLQHDRMKRGKTGENHLVLIQ